MIIGLTGNMGSGKSTVSRILEKFGAFVIDADKLCRQLMEPGQPAYVEIVELFGDKILKGDGTINRRELASIVFANDSQLTALESITHNHVKAETHRLIELASQSNEGFIVIDAPLLIKAGMHTLCDRVWLVYSGEETRISRIRLRDNLSHHEIISRFSKQLSYEEQRVFADTVIENEGDFISLENEVYTQLCSLQLV